MDGKLTIAAFGAHPDDLETLVFGTLAKYAANGHRINVFIATDGKRGRTNAEVAPSVPLEELRKKEAVAAAAHLGTAPVFLGLEDGRAVHDREAYEKVISVIEALRPDLIITHWLEDYHADHRALARLVLDAAGRAPVFFCDTAMGVGFEPQFYVDITAFHPKKMEAIREHISQNEKDLMAQYAELQSRFRGAQCGAVHIKYAECFRLYSRCGWVRAHEMLPV